MDIGKMADGAEIYDSSKHSPLRTHQALPGATNIYNYMLISFIIDFFSQMI